MGHKVHPMGFRLGVIKEWQSKWYSDTHYAEFVQEDNKLREEIKTKYPEAAISLIEIDRQVKDVTITLHTARPGIVIGRGGQRVEEMRQHLESLIGKKIRLNIQEIRQPELDAYLVAKSVAEQIVRRVAYRRAMKQSIFRTIQAGAKGIKISCAGRLANAEIARRQTSHQGQVPLHTLRADIDYGFTEAHTTLGRIGVKVWIYKGQILPEIIVTEVEPKPTETAAEVAVEMMTETIPATGETQPQEKPAEATTEAATKTKPTRSRTRKPAKPAEPKAGAKKPAKAKTTEEKLEKTKTAEEKITETKAEEEQPAPKRRRKTTAMGKAEEQTNAPEAEVKNEKELVKKKEEEAKDGTA